MPTFVLSLSQVLGVLLGLAYLVLALRSTWRFRESPGLVPGWQPKVSVLKPIHDTAPHLYERLRSFCEQDWPESAIDRRVPTSQLAVGGGRHILHLRVPQADGRRQRFGPLATKTAPLSGSAREMMLPSTRRIG